MILYILLNDYKLNVQGKKLEENEIDRELKLKVNKRCYDVYFL